MTSEECARWLDEAPWQNVPLFDVTTVAREAAAHLRRLAALEREQEERLEACIADAEALLAEVERLRAALEELVRLKDGQRDDAYRNAKEAAWQRAREALEPPVEGGE